MTHVKRTIGLVTAVLVVAVTGLAQAQPQFSGTWTLDRSQSQFPAHGDKAPGGAQGQTQPGTPQQPPVVKLLVEQNGTNFKVTRSMARDNRERTYSQSFVADGSESTRQGHRGSTTVSKATLGGDRLVTMSTTTLPAKDGGAAKSFSRESTWMVSPDGRTLTIDTVMHSPRGDRTMKTVYLKS